MANQYKFDWADLAFASKKPLKELSAVFIAAPRTISEARFKQLIKTYLPKGNVVVGFAKEDWVVGFEGQPQFTMLKQRAVQSVIDAVNSSAHKHKLVSLSYAQSELEHIIEKIPFKETVFVNGSWKYAFHNLPVFYKLASNNTPYALVPAFTDQSEAMAYAKKLTKQIGKYQPPTQVLGERAVLEEANAIAQHSFDYSFQTGAVLAKKAGQGFRVIAGGYNKVVPYQTYAMYHGASREANFSPPHDLNHYDTVHAEVHLLLEVLQHKLDIKGTTLFINLLPCPSCSRMLCETDISEVVYQNDHSDGYAVKLLEEAGKVVRRVVL